MEPQIIGPQKMQKLQSSDVDLTGQEKGLAGNVGEVHFLSPSYQSVAVSIENSRTSALAIPWSSSSDLRATVEANGMALLMPDHGLYTAGEVVEIWL